MKTLAFFLIINLFVNISITAQNKSIVQIKTLPCHFVDTNKTKPNPKPNITNPKYNKPFKFDNSSNYKVNSRFRTILKKLILYNNNLAQYANSLMKLNIEAEEACNKLNTKNIRCSKQADSIFNVYNSKAENLFKKYLDDTSSFKNYSKQYLSKKRFLGSLISDKWRHDIRNNKRKNKHILSPDSIEYIYECLRTSLNFKCNLSTDCPPPDLHCRLYSFNNKTCKCECKIHLCPPTSDCIDKERYWDSTLNECRCKEPIFKVVEATNSKMSNTIKSFNLDDKKKCLLSLKTNGKDAVFTIGIDMQGKTHCSKYFKNIGYADNIYELSSINSDNILDSLFKQISDFVKDNKYSITIRVQGTADSARCTRIYQGVNFSIPEYYLISENGSCITRENTEILKNNPLNNELLGILRAYEFEPLIEKYFYGYKSVTYYSLPYKLKRDKIGSFRKTEIYIMVWGFNNENYEKVKEVEKFNEVYKDCKECDSFNLLNVCVSKNKK
jgi:hypothetical protein